MLDLPLVQDLDRYSQIPADHQVHAMSLVLIHTVPCLTNVRPPQCAVPQRKSRAWLRPDPDNRIKIVNLQQILLRKMSRLTMNPPHRKDGTSIFRTDDADEIGRTVTHYPGKSHHRGWAHTVADPETLLEDHDDTPFMRSSNTYKAGDRHSAANLVKMRKLEKENADLKAKLKMSISQREDSRHLARAMTKLDEEMMTEEDGGVILEQEYYDEEARMDAARAQREQ